MRPPNLRTETYYMGILLDVKRTEPSWTAEWAKVMTKENSNITLGTPLFKIMRDYNFIVHKDD